MRYGKLEQFPVSPFGITTGPTATLFIFGVSLQNWFYLKQRVIPKKLKTVDFYMTVVSHHVFCWIKLFFFFNLEICY